MSGRPFWRTSLDADDPVQSAATFNPKMDTDKPVLSLPSHELSATKKLRI